MKLFLFFALVLTACSTTWVKPGASVSDFNQDAAFCRNDAYTRSTNALGQTNAWTQQPIYNNCMQSKGWNAQ